METNIVTSTHIDMSTTRDISFDDVIDGGDFDYTLISARITAVRTITVNAIALHVARVDDNSVNQDKHSLGYLFLIR
jgi:hypothetical protein